MIHIQVYLLLLSYWRFCICLKVLIQLLGWHRNCSIYFCDEWQEYLPHHLHGEENSIDTTVHNLKLWPKTFFFFFELTNIADLHECLGGLGLRWLYLMSETVPAEHCNYTSSAQATKRLQKRPTKRFQLYWKHLKNRRLSWLDLSKGF